MSRKEYMEQLDMLLRDIPHMERREALKYYEDYFEDAGEEHEADVIEELGSPEELAKKLREDLKREESEGTPAARGNRGIEGGKNQTENQKEGVQAKSHQAGNRQSGNYTSGNSQMGNGQSGNWQGTAAYPVQKPKNGYKAMTVCFIVLGILIGIGHLSRLVRGIVWLVVDISGTESIETITENYQVYGEDGIRDLDIKAGIGELIIESWNQEEVSISYPKTYMKVKKEGSELVLETKKRWFGYWRNWFGIWDDEDKPYQILIKIPKDYVFRDVEISTGAGTADIERLEAISIALKTGAGELDAKELIAAEEINIEAGVGETTIRNLQATKAEFSVGVGELDIKGRVDGDISAECGVGELTMELANEESDFNYEVSCGVGEVSVNGKDYSGIGRSHSNDNGASYDFDMSCGVGTIEVFFTGDSKGNQIENHMGEHIGIQN